MAANAAGKQRRRGIGRPFRPGQSGNPAGKRPGTRHRVTLLAEQLLDGEAEAIVRKAVESRATPPPCDYALIGLCRRVAIGPFILGCAN